MFTSVTSPASAEAANLGGATGLLLGDDAVSPVLCISEGGFTDAASVICGVVSVYAAPGARPEASDTPVRDGASIDELLASA